MIVAELCGERKRGLDADYTEKAATTRVSLYCATATRSHTNELASKTGKLNNATSVAPATETERPCETDRAPNAMTPLHVWRAKTEAYKEQRLLRARSRRPPAQRYKRGLRPTSQRLRPPERIARRERPNCAPSRRVHRAHARDIARQRDSTARSTASPRL
jgi:hypothetical protein